MYNTTVFRALGEEYLRMIDGYIDNTTNMIWKETARANEILARALIDYTEVVIGQIPVDNPYDTFDDMLESYRNGLLLISSNNSEHPVWTEYDNFNFRVVHDIIHCVVPQARGFSLSDDIAAAEVHAWLVTSEEQRLPDAQEVIWIETAAQASAFHITGAFPKQWVYSPGYGTVAHNLTHMAHNRECPRAFILEEFMWSALVAKCGLYVNPFPLVHTF